jgi:signal transduction histidine kinase
MKQADELAEYCIAQRVGAGNEMRRLLRNLIENAFLYSPASPEVYVTLKRSGKSCTLAVIDNGRGIDAKERQNIFKMFYRVRQSGETIRGTGLGLYIVKSIVNRHKGRIMVESAGSGARSLASVPESP